ncbi:MAG: hypothetical protein HY795_06160 [Desulfovibrio sp.]|nr:hypothetical protein [Desulfovibrio sp.]MBI4961318.1 hypothetical protein [Desulfovibrio sp.]
MDRGYVVERCFVSIICKKLKEAGINHSKAANTAFSDRKNGVNTWRDIRNFDRPKKPQRLNLGEAIALADVVGEPLHALLIEVDYALKNGWDLERDDPSPTCREKQGRRSEKPAGGQ